MHKTLKKLPPLGVLRFHYKYDSELGVLYKRQLGYNKLLKQQVYYDVWRPCVSPSIKEYGQYHAHRICWALHYDEDPYPWIIDHINRDHNDNRIDNLRKVTPAENTANRKPIDAMNVRCRKPVRIIYPDGRGSIVVDSLSTANQILGRTTLARNIRKDGIVYFGKGPGARDSGIRVSYVLT